MEREERITAEQFHALREQVDKMSQQLRRVEDTYDGHPDPREIRECLKSLKTFVWSEFFQGLLYLCISIFIIQVLCKAVHYYYCT